MAAALNAKAASPIWTQKQEFEHFGNVKQAEHEADAILTEWIRERELEVSLMDELLNLAPWAHGNCIINHDQADLEFKLQRPKDIARRESREVRAYMVMQWQAEAVEVEAERERQMNR